MADGWVLHETHGSHHQYRHPAKPGRVTIPRHSKDVPIGIVKSVLHQAKIKETK